MGEDGGERNEGTVTRFVINIVNLRTHRTFSIISSISKFPKKGRSNPKLSVVSYIQSDYKLLDSRYIKFVAEKVVQLKLAKGMKELKT